MSLEWLLIAGSREATKDHGVGQKESGDTPTLQRLDVGAAIRESFSGLSPPRRLTSMNLHLQLLFFNSLLSFGGCQQINTWPCKLKSVCGGEVENQASILLFI